jgi:hypothetical protein
MEDADDAPAGVDARPLAVAEAIGVDLATAPFTAEEFALGIAVEREQEQFSHLEETLGDDLIVSGRRALRHLREQPRYYSLITRAHAPGDPPTIACQYAEVGAD